MVNIILKHAYKRKTFIKYACSGITAALLDLALLFIFTDFFHVWYLFSAGLAFIAAFFLSFYLQKFWAFRESSREGMARQLWLYLVFGLTNLGLNMAGMFIFTDLFRIWYFFSQILTSCILALFSFLVYKHVVFKKIEQGVAHETNKEKIRLLIATGLYPPDFRGPATHLLSLPEALRRNNIEVKVLTYSDIPTSSDERSLVYRIRRQQPGIIKYLKFFWRLWRLAGWCDIIYATDLYSVGYFTYLAGSLKGKKYIIRFAGDSAWEKALLNGWTKDYIVDFLKKKYDGKIEKLKARRSEILAGAGRVISVSKFLGRLAEQIGAPKEKIKVIYNSLDNRKFVVNKDEVEKIRQKYSSGASGETKLIISVGQLNNWKGFDGLVKVMPGLKREAGKVNLLILGEGPEHENLSALAKSLGVEDSVHFLGIIPHEKILNYISAADLFILNSNYEGLSHAILEAMAAGRPIIASRAGGNVELIEDGQTGMLVDYNNEEQILNAAAKLLKDREQAECLTRAAKEKANGFVWEKTVRETVSLIQELSREK